MMLSSCLPGLISDRMLSSFTGKALEMLIEPFQITKTTSVPWEAKLIQHFGTAECNVIYPGTKGTIHT